MIARILVPLDIRPIRPEEAGPRPRRLSSSLDSRTVIPSNLPVAPLDGRTAIPSHIPFDVLAERTLVPRDTPAIPLRAALPESDYLPMTVLDVRMVVPSGMLPAELVPAGPLPPGIFEDVLEADLITTGEVHLLNRSVGERPSDWNQISRFASLVVHCILVVFVLLSPRLFPPHVPTQEEMDLARRQLSFVYLPPSVSEVPQVAPQPSPASPKMRIDPRVLHQVAPPEPETAPPPGPEAARVPPNLPSAPTPQPSVTGQRATPGDSARQAPRLETPKQPASNSLVLPELSPGKALEQSLQSALKGGGGKAGGFADPMPTGGGGSGGSGPGYLGGNLEILTPTEGVDFSNYLARLLESVKRNWYAVIPESARLGDRGRVILQFHISRDGNVPFPEPILVRTSGKEPLDRAAMAAIHASSPFEPLPPAFSGPYIELRFIFLYNLPLDYQ